MSKLKLALFASAAMAMNFGLSGQTFKEWQDPNINEINRLPMHANFFPFQSENEALGNVKEKSANYITVYNGYIYVAYGQKRLQVYQLLDNGASSADVNTKQ